MLNIQVLVRQLCKKTTIVTVVSLSLVACVQTLPAPIKESSGEVNDPQVIYTDLSENTPTPAATTRPSSLTNNQHYNRDYNEIAKGSYRNDKYTVQRGDTLFYIAWLSGNDFRELARKNNLTEPYELSVGQVLNVSGNTAPSAVVSKPPVQTKPVVTKPVVTRPPTQPQQTAKQKETKPKPPVTETVKAPAVTTAPSPDRTSTVSKIAWRWPTKGKIILPFSSATNGNKGIDIEGSQGQDIIAAADGSVVYAGNALPGYGNLIIIKHNNDYLSAYAHNDKILVKEQQTVKAGQRVATMGKTGASSTRLHFEIRHQAKSIDPLRYLPK